MTLDLDAITGPEPAIFLALLLVDRLPQPCSPSLTTPKLPLTLVTRSALYYLTCAKPLIKSLLQKLADLQLNSFILSGIGSYLLNRSQAVVFEGVQSSPLHVISGVPQGSVLGRLLFLVYIDKVGNFILSSNITMYAEFPYKDLER